MSREKEELLIGIGFSKLEAAIYIGLLREPNVTGYKIAQLIGKPVPNTYKALDSLRRKGAVIEDGSGRSKHYSPLPINVFLDSLERDFENRRKEIEFQFRNTEGTAPPEGIYRLENFDQVTDRSYRMLDSAEHLVIVDMVPCVDQDFCKALEEVAAKDVTVIVQVFSELELKGCDVLVQTLPQDPNQFSWGWLNIVIDGSEYILAFFDRETKKIYEAVWTRSPFMSVVLTNGIIHEILLRQVHARLKKDATAEDIKEFLKQYLGKMKKMIPALKNLYDYYQIELPRDLETDQK